MSDTNGTTTVTPKLGDRVKLRHAAGMTGRVVELRGPLGPGGVEIYRIQLRRKPRPEFIEVRGDQLEILTAAS